MHKLDSASELYGGLGTAFVLLLWLYLVARLVVASAVVNATLYDRSLRAGISRRRLTPCTRPSACGRGA